MTRREPSEGRPLAPVTGAPYSATMTNEMVQTLTDGTHITQTTTGNVARDSQGRTRQDAPLPSIGNLSAANAPHLVFIQDPVAQVSYTLDLTDKTAQKMPAMPLQALSDAATRVLRQTENSSARWDAEHRYPRGRCRPRYRCHVPVASRSGTGSHDVQRTIIADNELATSPPRTLARRPCRA